MASLFVSHSSHDRDEAERVAKRLRVEGFAALFLDFDPADGIPAGRDWKQELFAQLRKADGVDFFGQRRFGCLSVVYRRDQHGPVPRQAGLSAAPRGGCSIGFARRRAVDRLQRR